MERNTNLSAKRIIQHLNPLGVTSIFSTFSNTRNPYFPVWEELLHELGVLFIESADEEEALLIEAQFEIFLSMESEALRIAAYSYLTHPLLKRELSDRAVSAIASFRAKTENTGIIMHALEQQNEYMEEC